MARDNRQRPDDEFVRELTRGTEELIKRRRPASAGETAAGLALTGAQGIMQATNIVPSTINFVAPNPITRAASDFLNRGVQSAQALKPSAYTRKTSKPIFSRDDQGNIEFDAPSLTQVSDVVTRTIPQLPFYLGGFGAARGAAGAATGLGRVAQGTGKAAARADKALDVAGGAGANVGVVTGQHFEDVRQQGLEAGLTEEEASRRARASGARIAGLSALTGGVGLGAAAQLARGATGRVSGFVRGAAADVPFEAVEEAGESVSADIALDRPVNVPEALSAAALGGIAGGVVGGGLGAAEVDSSVTQPRSRIDEALDRADELRSQPVEGVDPADGPISKAVTAGAQQTQIERDAQQALQDALVEAERGSFPTQIAAEQAMRERNLTGQAEVRPLGNRYVLRRPDDQMDDQIIQSLQQQEKKGRRFEPNDIAEAFNITPERAQQLRLEASEKANIFGTKALAERNKDPEDVIYRLAEGRYIALKPEELSPDQYIQALDVAPEREAPTVERLSERLVSRGTSGPAQQDEGEAPQGTRVVRVEEDAVDPETATNVVARDAEGNPEGVLNILFADDGTPEAADLAVKPEARRQGIASELMRVAEENFPGVRQAAFRGRATEEGARFLHRQAVEQALREGRPVPEDVRSAYPQLEDRFSRVREEALNELNPERQKQQQSQPEPAREPEIPVSENEVAPGEIQNPAVLPANERDNIALQRDEAPEIPRLNLDRPTAGIPGYARGNVEQARKLMPTFQGRKTEMAQKATGHIAQTFGEQGLSEITTINDYFGGSGGWGAYLANLTPNVQQLRVFERNPQRLEKIRYFHERGDQLGQVVEQYQPALDEIARMMDESENVKKFSGSAVQRRAQQLINEGYADSPEFRVLMQAMIDQASSRGGQGETAHEAVNRVARLVTQYAGEVKQQMDQIRASRPQLRIEYRNEDSFQAPPDRGPNVLSVLDPPYYGTSDYDTSGNVDIQTYGQVKDMLDRVREADNRVLYTDEAWWTKSQLPKDRNKAVRGMNARQMLSSIANGFHSFATVPISSRTEVIGLYDPTQQRAASAAADAAGRGRGGREDQTDRSGLRRPPQQTDRGVERRLAPGRGAVSPRFSVNAGTVEFPRTPRDAAEVAGLSERELNDPEIVADAFYQWRTKGTDSPYFQRWFGESKVTRNGAPAVMFHGTDQDFTQFDLSFADNPVLPGTPAGGLGVFTTPNEFKASVYGTNVLRLYVRLENPYIMGVEEVSSFESRAEAAERARDLERQGHDGVFLRDDRVAIVFRPEQLKAADRNVGTFSEFDPDIRFSTNTTFHVPAFRAVSNRSLGAPDRGSGSQWRQWFNGMQRRGFIKKGERDWMDIDRFLEGRKSVTRDEVLEIIDANTPEIRVKRLTGREVFYQNANLEAGNGTNDREVLLHFAGTKSYVPDVEVNHFGEHAQNLLAWGRADDFESSEDGRMYRIKELQSDWLQRLRQAERLGMEEEPDTPPPAPFRRTEDWVRLQFKTMLRDATMEGYDSIAIPTGETAAMIQDMPDTDQRLAPFYDDIAPKAIEKFTKQFDGRFETKAYHNQPIINNFALLSPAQNELIEVPIRDADRIRRLMNEGWQSAMFFDINAEISKPDDLEEARRFVNEAPGEQMVSGPDNVPMRRVRYRVMKITPQMRESLRGSVPMWSTTSGQPGAEGSVVQEALDRLRKDWKNAPDIKVVQRTADLPFAAPPNATGAFLDGTVYMVADNIANVQHAEFVALHETTGHFGLLGALGKELRPAMMRIYNENKKLRAAADREMDLRPEVTDIETAVEEVLANIAGTGHITELTGWERFVVAVRNAMRRMGFNLAMGDADVIQLIADARQFVTDGSHTLSYNDTVKFHRAWHGSPHDWDVPSLTKVGTGEGGDAYGYGFNTAGSRDVAIHYRDLTAPPEHRFTVDGEPVPEFNTDAHWRELEPRQYAILMLGTRGAGAARTELIRLTQDLGKNSDYVRQYAESLRRLKGRVGAREIPRGRLYEIEAYADESEYLDHDAPLSEQPDFVQQIIREDEIFQERVPPDEADQMLGRDIYELYANAFLEESENGYEIASKHLHDRGIMGARYLDERARSLDRESLQQETDAYINPASKITEQTEKVIGRLLSSKTVREFINDQVPDAMTSRDGLADMDVTGQEFMDRLKQYLTGDESVQDVALERHLVSLRIPGTQENETLQPFNEPGHYNFVIFDDSIIETKAKFSVAINRPLPSRVDASAARTEDPAYSAQLSRQVDAAARELPDWRSYRGHFLNDWRPFWLKGLNRQQIVDIGKDVQPLAIDFERKAREMDAEANHEMEFAYETARKWAGWTGSLRPSKQKAGRQLADLMHDATLAGVDPAKSSPTRPDLREKYVKLRRRYEALPQELQELYVEVRDLYAKRRRDLLQALEERIEQSQANENTRREMTTRLRQEFESAEVQGVYFPLGRFGDFWVLGEKDGERTFEMFDSEKHQMEGRRNLEKEGWTVKHGRRVRDLVRTMGVTDTFMGQLNKVVHDTVDNEQVRDRLMDNLYQMYLQMLPEMSIRKHAMHRKGTPGFSRDALRAFSNQMAHSARQIARVRYGYELQDLLSRMARGADDAPDPNKAADIVNALTSSYEWMMNPSTSKAATKATSIGFAWYLGVTPAAALVNLSQIPLATLPYLGSRYGFAKAGGALSKGLKDYIAASANKNRRQKLEAEFGGDMGRALRELEHSGAITRTQSMSLMGLSEEDAAYTVNQERWIRLFGAAFQHAEVANREASAIATYRLARGKGKSHSTALDEAYQSIYDTHFDYSSANRAEFMRGNVSRVIFLFKQYALGMTYLIGRSVHQSVKGASKADKRIARKQLAGILGMTTLFSGTMGLPIAPIVFGVLNAFGNLDDDEEYFDAELAYRNWLAENLGPHLGNYVAKGVINPLTGADVATRVELSELFFRTPDRNLEGEDLANHYLQELAGPVFGMAINGVRGASMVMDGEISRGAEQMVPKFMRDTFRAIRYTEEGVKNMRGDPILKNVTPYQAFLQMVGFTPAELSEIYDQRGGLKRLEDRIMSRRADLLSAYWQALQHNDASHVREVSASMRRFNRKNPDIAITHAAVRRSVDARNRYSAQAIDGIFLNKSLRNRLEQMRYLEQ